MSQARQAALTLDGKTVTLPIIEDAQGETALDIRALRATSGWIAFDPGYANTAACQSAITRMNGETGLLQYRGYPLEQLAEKATFVETAMLLMFGDLPRPSERSDFRAMLRDQELLHENLNSHFDGFPPQGNPMAILSAMINSMGSYYPELYEITSEEEFRLAAAKIMSKVRTIAAFAYRKSQGLPFMYPNPNLDYCRNFMHMMFSVPFWIYEPADAVVRALTVFLIAHADHGLNSSCATVRMVGSSQANLFASISAGICALWGRLHGGAGVGVVDMFEAVSRGQISIDEILEGAKAHRTRLMGFGQRVYKSRDPRATIIRRAYENLVEKSLVKPDPHYDIALEIEERAMADDYFIARRLYPNVNYYSGLLLRALNIPKAMFPVMVAIGNMPGWIAHWHEESRSPDMRIHRPRQIYMGQNLRDWLPMDDR